MQHICSRLGRQHLFYAGDNPAGLEGLAYADAFEVDDDLGRLRHRLQAIRQVMAGDGSSYGPIDVKIEHYVRLLMDEVFGARNFRNSITRIKGNPKNFKRYYYGNIKDTILFYA